MKEEKELIIALLIWTFLEPFLFFLLISLGFFGIRSFFSYKSLLLWVLGVIVIVSVIGRRRKRKYL
jgi:hypothetical protein